MIEKNIYAFKIMLIFTTLFSVDCMLHAAPTTRVAFVHLEGEGISSQLERTINAVVLSFTNEIKGYIIEDYSQSSEENVNKTNGIEYILTGKIIAIDDGVRLELVLKNKQGQVIRNIAKDYEGSNKILLDSRLLVRELFESKDVATDEKKKPTEKIDPPQLDENDFKPISSIDSLAGAWYGEDGEVEKIMIMRGGRGVAIWVSGISLLLDLKLEDGSLIVTQKGIPQPRQFINLPDNIASLAAKATKPIVWRLNINQDLKILSGLKLTSTIKYNNSEIISVSEVMVPVKWHRD